MRSGGDRGEMRVLPQPAGEKIAYRVFAHLESAFPEQFFDESAPSEIGFGKQHACDDRRRGFGNGREASDFPLQTTAVNHELMHTASASAGGRRGTRQGLATAPRLAPRRLPAVLRLRFPQL